MSKWTWRCWNDWRKSFDVSDEVASWTCNVLLSTATFPVRENRNRDRPSHRSWTSGEYWTSSCPFRLPLDRDRQRRYNEERNFDLSLSRGFHNVSVEAITCISPNIREQSVESNPRKTPTSRSYFSTTSPLLSFARSCQRRDSSHNPAPSIEDGPFSNSRGLSREDNRDVRGDLVGRNLELNLSFFDQLHTTILHEANDRKRLKAPRGVTADRTLLRSRGELGSIGSLGRRLVVLHSANRTVSCPLPRPLRLSLFNGHLLACILFLAPAPRLIVPHSVA